MPEGTRPPRRRAGRRRWNGNYLTNDGQEVPVRGVDAIDSIAVITARPTLQGDPNDVDTVEDLRAWS